MWLWKPYIPLGKVTLLQAESSEIITSFLTGFLSEVSKGGNTPDGNQFGRPYKIIYQSSLSKDIIRERLETEDADCNQIGFMDGKQSELLETYLEDLEKALESSWSRVVVIDTIGAYSTEALLTGLVCLPRLKTLNQMIKLAQKNNCAVILTGLAKKVVEKPSLNLREAFLTWTFSRRREAYFRLSRKKTHKIPTYSDKSRITSRRRGRTYLF